MFTGLIEDIGIVKEISGSQITVTTKLGEIAAGDSIAVNGVCLTAAEIKKSDISFDYSPHTGNVTNLSQLKANSPVNLERALKLSSRLGGHIVSGHVDGSAKIEKIEKQQRFFKISFSCANEILKHCVDKGSVAADGISLTVAELSKQGFCVFIIPETFNNTALKFKKAGDDVNIENDILAKYAEKFSSNKNSDGITLDMLKGNGFI